MKNKINRTSRDISIEHFKNLRKGMIVYVWGMTEEGGFSNGCPYKIISKVAHPSGIHKVICKNIMSDYSSPKEFFAMNCFILDL